MSIVEVPVVAFAIISGLAAYAVFEIAAGLTERLLRGWW